MVYVVDICLRALVDVERIVIQVQMENDIWSCRKLLTTGNEKQMDKSESSEGF